MWHQQRVVGLGLVVGLAATGTAAEAQRKREIDLLVERTLVKPVVKVEAGFTATLLVPPGDLYDPLAMLPRNNGVWAADDGAQEGERGGRIWSIDSKGRVSTLVETVRLLPTLGFDIAPLTFGRFGGQLILFTQPRVGQLGIWENHLIQHLDLKGREPARPVCTLPNAGTNNGIPGAGLGARFGPPGSPFGDRFFAVALNNSTVYQMTADGACKAFVTFAGSWTTPSNIAFVADGSRMLVAVKSGRPGGDSSVNGAILAVAPDGTIDPTPVVVMQGEGVWALAVAPPAFGPYAGQVFFATRTGEGATGKIYRLARGGSPYLVASGFFMPFGMTFVNDALWIGDVQDDYIGGGVHWPDGFVVTIRRN